MFFLFAPLLHILSYTGFSAPTRLNPCIRGIVRFAQTAPHPIFMVVVLGAHLVSSAIEFRTPFMRHLFGPLASRFVFVQATARAASGSLTPAHGGSGSNGGGDETGPGNNAGDRAANDESHEGERAPVAGTTAAAAATTVGQGLTGYVESVRDDLTAFVSSEREAVACAGGGGAVGRTLDILARLGKDLGRMVRLRGGVEHQVRFTGVYSGRGGRRRGARDMFRCWCPCC